MTVKIVSPGDPRSVVQRVFEVAGGARRLVFVSGNFNVVHPGHLRLLNFAAECGDFLVVGVTGDDRPGTMVPASLRLEGVSAISVVGCAVLLPVPPEQFIAELKPAIVVKGKEHEAKFNPEKQALDAYGGDLLFSSGEVRFSSLDLLKRELLEERGAIIRKVPDFLLRHQLSGGSLAGTVSKFPKQRVVVIGDLIVDEYITCEPLGMSQEDPTIVVSPIKSDRFIGGAGIVAAHAVALGANVSYFGIAGNDATTEYALRTLKQAGVAAQLELDSTRPTTLKQRFRARNKTLLRVSHLRQHDISHELVKSLFERIRRELDNANLLVFSDFSYGCLPQALVELVIEYCRKRGVPMVADSQSSSQVGDISRFSGMLLVTPTEHEARLAMRDSTSGLVVLAENLKNKTMSEHVFITLGSEGVLIHADAHGHHGLRTDQLPAMNSAPKDVSGAGDCLLITASLALVAGANVWESAYLGSIAAACQVGRVGNLPLTSSELLRELAA